MGPGGEEVGNRLARQCLSIVGVEARLLRYFACIPTKVMLVVRSRISGEATTDWDDKAAVERFESVGGRFVRGVGKITAPGAVSTSRFPLTGSAE